MWPGTQEQDKHANCVFLLCIRPLETGSSDRAQTGAWLAADSQAVKSGKALKAAREGV